MQAYAARKPLKEDIVMKVMVYHEEPQKKDYYARIVQAVSVKLTIPCEVHGLLSWQAVKPLLDEPEAFDVYLLQGSRAGLKLALQIRAQTCVPAIIFLEAASVKLSDIVGVSYHFLAQSATLLKTAAVPVVTAGLLYVATKQAAENMGNLFAR